MPSLTDNDKHPPLAITNMPRRPLRGNALAFACVLSALTAGTPLDSFAKDKTAGVLQAQPKDPVLACDVAMLQDAIDPEFTFDNSGFNDGSQPMTVEIQLDSAQSLSIPAPANNPYCRIDGRVLTPGEDVKDVSFQVSMPTLNFNGRYFGAGQGGFPGTGSVSNPPADKLNDGWAAASNDRGQQGVYITGLCPGTCGFHIGTVAAQRVTNAFYNSSSLVRYAAGCSGGGADGRGNMQVWGAEDFDGILSGASPASIGLVLGYVRIDKYLQAHPEGAISNALLAQAEETILARYDDADGALDGIIQDDRNFRLDDQVLRDVGFTDAQIATVHFVNSTWHYDSPAVSADGRYGGYPISRLSNWSLAQPQGYQLDVQKL